MNPPNSHPPKILGFGAGGHCRVLIDIIRLSGNWQIHGLLDPEPAMAGGFLDAIPILGNDSLAPQLWQEGIRAAFLGVGSIGDSSIRQKIFRFIRDLGFELPILIHPSAIVAKAVAIGPASCVMPGAILNPGCSIGTAAIINSGAIIEHDCLVGDFSHISPGAVLGGGVRVGEGAHIGIGATIRQGITIGQSALVGAGAVVINHVPDGAKVIGIPAKAV